MSPTAASWPFLSPLVRFRQNDTKSLRLHIHEFGVVEVVYSKVLIHLGLGLPFES